MGNIIFYFWLFEDFISNNTGETEKNDARYSGDSFVGSLFHVVYYHKQDKDN